MAKTIKLPTEIDFGSIKVNRDYESSIDIEATGSDNVAIDDITVPSNFSGKASGGTYSSTIPGFTLTAGSQFVDTFGSTTASDYCTDIKWIDANTFVACGYSSPAANFDGTARTNPTKRCIWINKYSIDATNTLTKDWTYIKESPTIDYWCYNHNLQIIDGYIYVLIHSNTAGFSLVNANIILLKIQPTGTTDALLTVFNGAANTLINDIGISPLFTYSDYLFCGYTYSGAPGKMFICRITPEDPTVIPTLEESFELTDASDDNQLVGFRDSDDYLDIFCAYDLTGTNDYTYAVGRLDLGPGDSLETVEFIENDYYGSDYIDPSDVQDKAFCMTNQAAYLDQTEDLLLTYDINFSNSNYYAIVATSLAKINTIVTDKFSVDTDEDFKIETKIQFYNTTSGITYLYSNYLDANNYKVLYLEGSAVAPKLKYSEYSVGSLVNSIVADVPLPFSASNIYTVTVSRIDGVGKIELDSVNITTTEDMDNSVPKLKGNHIIGNLSLASGSTKKFNIYYLKKWLGSDSGTFSSDYLKFKVERESAKAQSYEHFIVNTAVDSFYQVFNSAMVFKSATSDNTNKRIALCGNGNGFEYVSGEGNVTNDCTFGIYNTSGLFSSYQFEYTTISIFNAIAYNSTRNILLCGGESGSATFEGNANPSIGFYSPVYCGMSNISDTETVYLGESETITIKINAEFYNTTYDQTMSITSDAVSTPDSVSLVVDATNTFPYGNTTGIDNKTQRAINRILNQDK